MSKASNIIDSFTGFVGHYAGEAKVVANALSAILDAVRPDSAITATVKEAITVLETAIGNIANSAPPVPVTINKDDVTAAVGDYLSAHLVEVVAAEVAKQLAANAPASENPTTAPTPSGNTGETGATN